MSQRRVLFNSYIYIFGFLPLVVTVYFFLSQFTAQRIRNVWLITASFFFYGFWNPVYVPLLFGSLLFNYYVGGLLSGENSSISIFQKYRKLILVAGISFNLLVLGIFKYTDFAISNVNWLFGSEIPLQHILLPLAISFVTFQKIAYLVDSYKKKTSGHDFIGFSLFVTFFPQLIAGPIVHHAEMIPQFTNKESSRVNYRNISVGLFIFLIGLLKKVGIADTFAVWANAGFAYQGVLTFYDAWATSLAYTFQLYFDFSGYTDMAIGSALLFNIVLPFNFNSPYQSLNIQDFWRRWHMTLSRFLRDYIYIPLGGNRQTVVRVYAAIFLVFLIGGFWHGASWTFVVWGMLHGIAVILYRLWHKYSPVVMPRILAWFITFNFINITWVFFRAETFPDAFRILASMFGTHGVSGQSELFTKAQWLVERIGVDIGGIFSRGTSVWIALSLLVVTLFWNSNELQRIFRPTVIWLTVCIFFYVLSVITLNSFSEFIYFNF